MNEPDDVIAPEVVAVLRDLIKSLQGAGRSPLSNEYAGVLLQRLTPKPIPKPAPWRWLVEEYAGTHPDCDGIVMLGTDRVSVRVLREVKPISRADCQHLYNLVRRSEWPAVLGDFIACLKSMGLEIDDAK
jgi:hypothetical protein